MIFQDRLEALHEHSQGSLLVRVLNQELALGILKREGVVCTVQDEGLEISRFADPRTARIITALCEGGAGVCRVEERQKTLEEIFLSLTGRRGSL